MQTTDPDLRLHVAVGVMIDRNHDYLIQQRPAGKICSGMWEFPGGKIEKGESAKQALVRELAEELGVTVLEAKYLARILHDYDHANVMLEVYLINRFSGQPRSIEEQVFTWASKDEIAKMNVLEAVFPILEYL